MLIMDFISSWLKYLPLTRIWSFACGSEVYCVLGFCEWHTPHLCSVWPLNPDTSTVFRSRHQNKKMALLCRYIDFIILHVCAPGCIYVYRYVYVCICIQVCVPCTCNCVRKPEEGMGVTSDGSTCIWVPVLKLWSPRRAARTPNFWAISPAPISSL